MSKRFTKAQVEKRLKSAFKNVSAKVEVLDKISTETDKEVKIVGKEKE